MNYYLDVLKKYVTFSGRARRKEYWMFTLVNCIISYVISMIEPFIHTQITTAQGISFGIISIIYSLAVLLPSLAVGVRRLHDTDRSGWWYLIALVPFVGWIVLLVFFCMDGTPGDNKFGPNPKA